MHLMKETVRRRISRTKENRGGHRLQLVLAVETRHLLDQLKEISEAESYGELIRRALIALEHFYPIDKNQSRNIVEMSVKGNRQVGCTERLQIVLPERSMERLGAFRREIAGQFGSGSYSEVIRRALKVYAQIYRNAGMLGDLDRSKGVRKEKHEESIPSTARKHRGDCVGQSRKRRDYVAGL
jgi:hypothetical protein